MELEGSTSCHRVTKVLVCLDVKLVGAKPAALVVGAATRAGKEVSVKELRTQLLESQLGREIRAGKEQASTYPATSYKLPKRGSNS